MLWVLLIGIMVAYSAFLEWVEKTRESNEKD